MKKLIPYITEKSVELTKSNKYTLEVSFDTTKKEIEALVRKFYGVNPLSINILKTKYLQKTKYRRQSLARGVKRAIVDLEKGKIIPGFEFESKQENDKKDKEKVKSEKKKVKDGKES